jgi:hypothetical protein
VVDHPIILTGIIIAFVVFGIVVAYVDRIATRRPDGQPAEQALRFWPPPPSSARVNTMYC